MENMVIDWVSRAWKRDTTLHFAATHARETATNRLCGYDGIFDSEILGATKT